MANIEHIQYVKAPVADVYKVLTSAEGLAEIWTQELSFKAEIGAINEFRFGDETPTKMEITDLIPNQRMDWCCVDSDPEWIGTCVHFELSEKAGVTSIVLQHTDWREVTEFYRFCNYNWAIFLLSLKEFCEGGDGIHYQVRKF
jgi:uncharacterized protein YndB with AHSA1/START domain